MSFYVGSKKGVYHILENSQEPSYLCGEERGVESIQIAQFVRDDRNMDTFDMIEMGALRCWTCIHCSRKKNYE